MKTLQQQPARTKIPSDHVKDLANAVTIMHGCPCVWYRTSYVHEWLNGKSVWKGLVEVFTLIGHPTANMAFAWSWKDKAGEIRDFAVLKAPLIKSAAEAVRSVIASAKQKW